MFWTIVAIVLGCLFAISVLVQKREKDIMKRRNDVPRYKIIEIPVVNSEHIEEFVKKYDDQFIENDDYRFRQARMKEEHYGEKVYRYSPAYLPVKVEGHDVYSKLDDWVKVGEIGQEINGEPTLMLYINEYKEVRNLGIDKVKGDPFYLLKVKIDL